ncbi:hypothetical protein KQH60_10415 [Mycetohabitans sp. B8]|uniref:hypothetical protein n=1 Tax=Mycetohabitans sp. B8 TaxID=2841845 RepID=UPI001F1BDF97|nr:hypothetical protein [Mycetohabitans sp. B8]MCG1042920.1 hypothetical protein [Mycetohabitans sp. B8]
MFALLLQAFCKKTFGLCMRYVRYSAGATDNSLRFVGFVFVPFGDFINESSLGAGLGRWPAPPD